MNSNLVQLAKEEFNQAVEHLKKDFSTLQIGRSNPKLVEDLEVESYGARMILKSIATISTPDAKTISIQPWDRNLLSAIEKAVLASSLGLNPLNDGMLIRINLPALTEERRISLKKVVAEKAENCKIAMRNIRHKVHNEIKVAKEKSEITEDDFFGYDKDLQEVLSEFTKKVDDLSKEKEKDIMTV